MSIYAFTGTPGSGKSYGAVENHILPMLRQGRRVVTNIPLHLDRIRETISTGELVELPLDRVVAEPDTINEYATPGSVLVIDEAWKLYPPQQQNKIPIALKTLLAEHRHMVDAQRNSMVIVLIVQDLSMVNAFVRGLVESTYQHTKLSALGIDRAYRVDIYSGAVTGHRPPESKKVRSLNGFFKTDTWKLYKSHTMSETDGEGAKEKSADSRALLWKRPVFFALPVMLLLFLIFGIPKIMRQFSKSAAAQGRPGAPATLPPAAPGQSRPGGALAVAPALASSSQWFIRGSMTFEGEPSRDVVYLFRGGASVTLPMHRYCDRTAEGWTICDYDGQRISDEIRYAVPRVDTRALSSSATLVSSQNGQP